MSSLTWRATFWFCFAFALSIFTYLFFFFRETYRDNAKFDLVLPTANDNEKHSSSSLGSGTIDPSTELPAEKTSEESIPPQHNKEANLDTVSPPVKRSMNPFAAFLLLRHPFIFLSSVISGIAFGCMFAVETIIPDLYETRYGFNSWQTGKFF